ncbi:hypothetical protein AHAS_Ahas13G0320300 [Arachis hypogaea]
MSFLSSPIIFENSNKHPINLITILNDVYPQFTSCDRVTLPNSPPLRCSSNPTPPRSRLNRILQHLREHVCVGDHLFGIRPSRWHCRDRTAGPPCRPESLPPSATPDRTRWKHHRCTVGGCISDPCFANGRVPEPLQPSTVSALFSSFHHYSLQLLLVI